MVLQYFHRSMFVKSCYGDEQQALIEVRKSIKTYMTCGNPHHKTVVSRLASLLKIEQEQIK